MLTSVETPVEAPAVETKMPATVILRSTDHVEFAVPMAQLANAHALQSLFKGNESALSVLSTKGDVPTVELSHVSSLILSKVLTFLAMHQDLVEYDEKTFKCTDQDFEMLDSTPNPELLQLAFAANVLEIPTLLHSVGEIIAKKINGQEDDKIKELFNLDGMEVAGADEEMEVVAEDQQEWEEMEEMEETDELEKESEHQA